MVKKLFSFVSVLAVLLTSVSGVAFAADFPIGGVITSVNLTVAGATPATFNPTTSQVLSTQVALSPSFANELLHSTGSVTIRQVGANNVETVVKTLKDWTDQDANVNVST